MPGLPRKSTANQFKKLMKKSGKSRTNKSSGGTDPSRKKIATYEQFINLLESKISWWKDGDFTDEEDDNLDYRETGFVDIGVENLEVGLEIYREMMTIGKYEFFGSIIEIIPVSDDDPQPYRVKIITDMESKFIIPLEKFMTYDFKMKVNNSNESINELDPYGEENWDDNTELDKIYDYIMTKPEFQFEGYEWANLKEEKCIELLEIEDDELQGDEDFYVGIFGDDRACNIFIKHKKTIGLGSQTHSDFISYNNPSLYEILDMRLEQMRNHFNSENN